jgi:hypothetical protein
MAKRVRDKNDLDLKSSDQEFQIKNVPDLTTFNHQLEGLNEKIYNIKMTNRQTEFIEKIKLVLSLFDKESNQYNHSIMLFVMSCVEDYILKPKSGEYKKSVVIECVKDYYDNNIVLIEKMIPILMPHVAQNKFFKRNGKKIMRFFLKLLPTKS